MLIIAAVIVHLLTFVKCLRCIQVHIKLQNLLNNLNNRWNWTSRKRQSKEGEQEKRRQGQERLWEWYGCKVDLCAFMVYDNSTKTVNETDCNLKLVQRFDRIMNLATSQCHSQWQWCFYCGSEMNFHSLFALFRNEVCTMLQATKHTNIQAYHHISSKFDERTIKIYNGEPYCLFIDHFTMF